MERSAYLNIEIENNGSAGGKMRGKLLLDVRKVTSADFMMFHFYGYERTKITYNLNAENNEGSGERVATETANLYSCEVVLHRFAGGSVPRGLYAFPFEFNIPSDLPVSQSHKSGSNYCYITYHCCAMLHRPGMLAWEVKNSCEVLLNDKPHEAFPVPLFLGPSTFEATFMDNFFRGTITFGGKVHTANACGNETLRVNYAISNESKSSVHALEFDITCQIKFRAGNRHCFESHSIFHRRITVANLSRIEPVTRLGQRKVDCVTLLNQLNEGEYGIDIPIGNNHRSTYKSLHSSVTYELSMTMMTSYGTKNSTIRVPIIMHRHGANFAGHVPKVGSPFPMPAGWDGIVMPTAELILEEPVAAYDTVPGLTVLLKASDQWKESKVLRDWLIHAPYNVNLLTPDTMFKLFQGINIGYSTYLLCHSLGSEMNRDHSNNKCTCRHIAEAVRAVPSQKKIEVCNFFEPHCTDRHNASKEFSIIGFTDIEMSTVMMKYR